MSNASLSDRMLRGVGWNMSNALGGFVFQFVRAIVLARLLEPADFGITGIALGITATVGMFIDLGLSTALIQTSTVDRRTASSAFWVQVIAAGILAATASAISPWIAVLYGDPRLLHVLWASWLGLVVGSTIIVPQALLQRDLRFKETNLVYGASRLVATALSIAMALGGWGYWSLILPDVIVRMGISISFLIILRWVPKLTVKLHNIRHLFNMAGQSILSSWFATLTTNIDYLVLGKFLPQNEFGLYFFAFQRVRGPLKIAATTVRGALVPGLCRAEDRGAAVRRGCTQGAPVLALLLYPCVTVAILVAGEAVPMVFGLKWSGASGMMRLFAVWAYFLPILLFISPYLVAEGRMWDLIIENGVRACLMFVGLSALGFSGTPVIWCAVLVVVLEVIGNSWVASRVMSAVKLQFKHMADVMRAPIISSLVIVLFDLSMASLFSWGQGPISLAMRAAADLFVGLTSAWWLDRLLIARGVELVTRMLGVTHRVAA